jgi:hypothetical protein
MVAAEEERPDFFGEDRRQQLNRQHATLAEAPRFKIFSAACGPIPACRLVRVEYHKALADKPREGFCYRDSDRALDSLRVAGPERLE